MANTNSAFGLKPIDLMGSGANSNGATAYFIKSDASAIYQGSPVIATNDGTIAVGSASGDTQKLIGAFAGCEYVDANTGKKTYKNYWAGSGTADTNYDIIAYVYDNPMQRFVICTDASFTNQATARAAIFENAQMSSGASGSTVNGVSSAAMDIDGIDATNASLPLKIVGIYNDPDNLDYTAAGVGIIVTINNHALLSNDVETAVS